MPQAVRKRLVDSGRCVVCWEPAITGRQMCSRCRQKKNAYQQARYRLLRGLPVGAKLERRLKAGPPPLKLELLNIPHPTPEEEREMDEIVRQRAASIRTGWSADVRAERMEIYPLRRPA